MNRLMTFTAGLCLFLPAFANANPALALDEDQEIAMTLVEALEKPHHPQECEQVQLDDAQKTALREAKFAYAKQKNTTDAALKNAWMDYVHTLVDTTSTKDIGLAAANNLKTTAMTAGTAKMNFELKVFYDILKPEQRMPALRCTMKIKRQKMMERLIERCSKLPPKQP
ncbi:Spy/CpxP family protein refolding chaperone [Bdellovibrio sp. 22V]|uniref:Spy/CpxP family protein refolding chaperone n=1 Tax=Bdellovibrio TaxID=958 RepID=UPI0025432F85|nr:Spy/CpxP family protein refolding chaperone [Bdellovibrio sp. 22V]WII73640.1 Spy/CpxP family protein refolding chaperone [Bdellovibrio sp. 22V]